MNHNKNRSHCPVNFALETFGDCWSLLIIRDIVFWGKKTFKEFAESREGIATNILSSRLDHLIENAILSKKINPHDHRKAIYELTEKGLDLIPILLEMSGWSGRYDPETIAPNDFIRYVFDHRDTMYPLIRKTIRGGGSLFAGENSVISLHERT